MKKFRGFELCDRIFGILRSGYGSWISTKFSIPSPSDPRIVPGIQGWEIHNSQFRMFLVDFSFVNHGNRSILEDSIGGF